jgi:hypothetical protein
MRIGLNEGTDVSLDEPSCLRLNLLDVGRNSVISQMCPCAVERRDHPVGDRTQVFELTAAPRLTRRERIRARVEAQSVPLPA